MAATEGATTQSQWSLDPQVAKVLAERGVVSDVDRSGLVHLLVKVPDLEGAARADVGVELNQETDGCVALAVLLHDDPDQPPISCDLRFFPDHAADLRALQGLLETSQFRLLPCCHDGRRWSVGPVQTFRLPPNALLRLKHYSLSWPTADEPVQAPSIRPPSPAVPGARGPDPRDTVIRKLKEQVEGLRAQLQERDKRIVELEDELHDIKSRGRGYRLTGERKTWWKPFS